MANDHYDTLLRRSCYYSFVRIQVTFRYYSLSELDFNLFTMTDDFKTLFQKSQVQTDHVFIALSNRKNICQDTNFCKCFS